MGLMFRPVTQPLCWEVLTSTAFENAHSGLCVCVFDLKLTFPSQFKTLNPNCLPPFNASRFFWALNNDRPTEAGISGRLQQGGSGCLVGTSQGRHSLQLRENTGVKPSPYLLQIQAPLGAGVGT